jgi:hypothetical protein
MGTQKTDVLVVGKGAINSNTGSSHVFTSNVPVTTYSGSATYSAGNVVEYSGGVWRSLQGSNTGNTPISGSAYWELVYPGVQDGDIAIVVAGPASDLMIRQAGAWVPISSTSAPSTAVLPANTTNYTWLTLLSANFGKVFIQYSLVRNTYIRSGFLTIVTDGTTAQVEEFGCNQLNGDVGVSFDAANSGGNLNLTATIDNSVVTSVSMTYELLGWM